MRVFFFTRNYGKGEIVFVVCGVSLNGSYLVILILEKGGRFPPFWNLLLKLVFKNWPLLYYTPIQIVNQVYIFLGAILRCSWALAPAQHSCKSSTALRLFCCPSLYWTQTGQSRIWHLGHALTSRQPGTDLGYLDLHCQLNWSSSDYLYLDCSGSPWGKGFPLSWGDPLASWNFQTFSPSNWIENTFAYPSYWWVYFAPE